MLVTGRHIKINRRGTKSSKIVQSSCIEINRDRVKSSQIESNRVKSSQIESNRVKSSQIESNRVKSSQIESNRVKSSQIESNRVKSSQIESLWVTLSQIELTISFAPVSRRSSRRLPVPVSQDRSHDFLRRFAIGLLAGVLGSVINIPFDVAKSRIQGPQPVAGHIKYRSCVQTVLLVYREEGYVHL